MLVTPASATYLQQLNNCPLHTQITSGDLYNTQTRALPQWQAVIHSNNGIAYIPHINTTQPDAQWTIFA